MIEQVDFIKEIHLKINMFLLVLYTVINNAHNLQHLLIIKALSNGVIIFNFFNLLMILSYFVIRSGFVEAGNHIMLITLSATMIAINTMGSELYSHNNIMVLFPMILSIFLTKKRFTVAFVILNIMAIIYLNIFKLDYNDWILPVILAGSIIGIIGVTFYLKKLILGLDIIKNRKTQEIYDSTFKILGYVSEIRDKETQNHLGRVSVIVEKILIRLKKISKYSRYISQIYIADCVKASTLHDIGKIGISDSILLKSGKLTAEEFEEMKKHTLIGAEILEDAQREISGRSIFDIAIEIARHHHERWDGTGYPYGLKEDQIPLSARIMALADVYDALVSKRPYKKSMSHEEAVKIINDWSGSYFDPDIIKTFKHVQKEIPIETHRISRNNVRSNDKNKFKSL